MGKIMLNEIDYSGGNANVIRLTQAEYDALPPTKLTDNNVYMITDTNGDGSQFQPVIYSEDEREVGVWVDGKPLYQKTIVYTDNISTEQSIQHGILNLDKFIFVSGYIEMNWEGGGFEPLINPALGDSSLSPQYSNCIKDISSQSFTVCIGQSRLNQGVNAIVVNFQYTKTTDTAGSGTWTPQGVPAVHYNTDEKVVGTWIDGNTIYGKTFTNLSESLTNVNDWNNTSILLDSSIKQIINCKMYRNPNNYLILETVKACGVNAQSYLQIVPSESNTINVIYIEYTKSTT